MYILVFILITFVVVAFILYTTTFNKPTEFFIESIKEELDLKGLKLIKVKKPVDYNSSPFPPIDIKFSVETNIGGIKGERQYIRIIVYRTPGGEIKKTWVKIDVNAFVITKLEWSPTL